MVSPTQEDLDPQGNIPNITKARIQFQRLFLSPPMGLPQVMQAVVIPVHGDASVLRYTKVPTPQPGPGEVLVKVGAVGLNHLDIFVRRGMPGKAVHLPHISGADVAGVGTGAVQIAKLAGAHVIAGTGSPSKAQRLQEIGADEVVETGDGAFDHKVWALTGKRGVDVVVNYTGGDTWIPSIRVLRKGGRLVTVGATAGYESPVDVRYVWVRELNLLGSDGWTPEELRTLCRVTWEGRIRPIIDRVLPLSQAAEGEEALERREVFGKVILRPD